MKNQPLVCICIPYYNDTKIFKTLESLIVQTYKNIIIKIFDNASDDGSFEALKEYEKKYKNIYIYRNETNIGGEANFTKCIQSMEGEYSAIFHSDDIYLPTIVEEEVAALSSNDISAVFTNAYQIDENENVIGNQFYPTEFNEHSFIKLNAKSFFELTLKYGNFITCPSCMAKTNIYKNVIKSFNGSDFNTSADLDVWLRFAEFKDIGIINKYLMNYRVSQSSFSYNLAQVRVKRHDMFLVLDYYIENKKIEFVDKGYYDLLLLKDNAEIVFNKLNGPDCNVKINELNVFDFKNFYNAIKNKRLLKYYVFALGVKIIILIRLERKKNILNFFHKIRFKK